MQAHHEPYKALSSEGHQYARALLCRQPVELIREAAIQRYGQSYLAEKAHFFSLAKLWPTLKGGTEDTVKPSRAVS